MTLSALFAVNGVTTVQAYAVAYGSTVTFTIQSLTGIETIAWTILGTSKASQAAPALTLSGTPTGATATVTMPSDPGDGLGRSFLMKLEVGSQAEGKVVSYRVFGVANVVGIVPLAVGEELYRSATHGWTEIFNKCLVAAGLVVQLSLAGVYNVKDYGAFGDNGVHDDSTAVAAAVTACQAAGGGDVYFPPGIYSTNNLTVSAATGIRFRGAGHKASIIKARQSGQVVTFLNCTGCLFEDLAIERGDSLFQSSGGYALSFQGCVRCGGSSIRITYCSAGILLQSTTHTHFRGQTIIEKMTAGGGAGFVLYTGTAAAPCFDCSFEKVVYEHSYPVTPTSVKGGWTASTAYVVGDIVNANDRYYICATAGTSASSGGPTAIPGTDGPTAYTTQIADNTVRWQFLIGNSFGVNMDHDTSDLRIGLLVCNGPINNGVQMWNTLVNAPSGLFIDRCQIGGAITNAVILVAGSRVRIVPDIKTTYSASGIGVNSTFGGSVEIIGGKIDSCWLEGIAIASADVSVLGTEVVNCSQKGSGVTSGITVYASTSKIRIHGCRSGGSKCAYGVAILGASCFDYSVRGNDLTGNATGGFFDTNSSAAFWQRKVYENIGDDSDLASYYNTLTGTVSAINLFNAVPPAGLYRVTAYLATSGATGGTASVDVASTDDKGSTTPNVFSGFSISGTARKSASIDIETDGVHMPTFSCTLTSPTGSPNYTLRMVAKRMTD